MITVRSRKAAPAGLRGGKGTGWDGGYRVPFIARWPGHIAPRTTVTAMSMNIDLLPSFAALAGASLSNSLQLDGHNILPLLTGGADVSPHQVLYFFNNERIAALRTQRWRLLLSDYPPWRDAKTHLVRIAEKIFRPCCSICIAIPTSVTTCPGIIQRRSSNCSGILQHGREMLESLSTFSDGEMYEGVNKN